MNNSLIYLLEELQNIFGSSNDFNSSYFKNRDEGINYLKSIIEKISANDNEAIDKIVYAFGDNGFLKEIAINGKWEREYEEINNKFNEIIIDIRQSQKNDASLFNNVKDGIYTAKNTFATSPGRINISDKKWEYLISYYKMKFIKRLLFKRKRRKIQECISFGDTNPALVVSLEPLIISAYAYDLDAVVMLRFPQEFVEKYNLNLYDRLISVNTYYRARMHYDIFYGKNYSGWADVAPIIVNFLSDEIDKIEIHKNNIPNATWEYIKKLSNDYIINHKELYRNGFWFI